jgi:hypothetical protein
MVMLRFWLNLEGNRATGNALERALRKCDREDVVNKCMFNVELVTDEMEQSAAKAALHLDQVTIERFILVYCLEMHCTATTLGTQNLWPAVVDR